MKYYADTGVALQRWIEDFELSGICICDSNNCANVSHNNMIDNAYMWHVAILGEGNAQYYVKKRVNSVAEWSAEVSKLKSDS